MRSISSGTTLSAASMRNEQGQALELSAEARSGVPVDTPSNTIVDGCSGKISWLWRKVKGNGPAFEYCCDEHDLFYDQGGGWRERLFADRLLRDCMLENLRRRKRPLHPAWVFYVAVRVCGWLYWKKG